MNIHQLNVGHNDRQDRLLLRVNTQTAEEFRFWLTRRMALRLLPALQQALGRMESSQPQMVAPDPASQQMLSELKRDAFMQQADFKTPYVEQAQPLPLGDEPMLVTDVQLNFQPSGLHLTLQDKGAAGGLTQTCQLHLQPDLVRGLIHLVGQAMEKASWQTVAAASAAQVMPSPDPSSITGYRH